VDEEMFPFLASPPLALRARLLERIAGRGAAEGEPSTTAAGDPVLFNEGGLLISRSTIVPWIPGNVAGVHVKPLFVDAARNYTTALVRMEPGTVYPSHRHNDVEELFLLEGALLVEGLRMGPGDYCRAEPNSLHGQVSTDSGALFLVLASNANEIVA
jgi:quercetin dioxygenase-like cupin family protein